MLLRFLDYLHTFICIALISELGFLQALFKNHCAKKLLTQNATMQNAVHAVAMLCACTFCVIFPLALNFTLDGAMTAFCTYHVYDLSPSPNKPWQ